MTHTNQIQSNPSSSGGNPYHDDEDAPDNSKTQQTKEWFEEQTDILKNKCQQKAREVSLNTRERISEKLMSYEEACNAAGDKLNEKGESQAAEIAKGAATQINRTATRLRETEPEEAMEMAAVQVRSNPMLILGASFIIGLAASRLLSAATADKNHGPGTNGKDHSPRSRNPQRVDNPTQPSPAAF